jgi:hypothetical protein
MPVVLLIRWCSPADVTRLIVTVVINPVESPVRHTGSPAVRVSRTAPDRGFNITDEPADIPPVRAHADPAGAIAAVSRMTGVVAAAHHVPPGVIKGMMSKAVSPVGSPRAVPSARYAGFRVAVL